MYFSGIVPQYLHQKYANASGRKAGPISWPPPSLDLTQWDYHYGRSRKICVPCISGLCSELNTGVTQAVANIDKHTLKKVYKTLNKVYAWY